MKIHLFGPLRVEIDGVPMAKPRTRSVEWLLALLAMRPGQRVSRVWLAETLWPDSYQSQALENLRHDLMHLRKSMGAESSRLTSDGRDFLTLNLEDCDCDLLKFDDAARRRDHQALVAAHPGPLLEGCAEDWAIAERQVRWQQCIDALLSMADVAQSEGDPASGLRWLLRAQAMEPLRDSTIRSLMSVQAAVRDEAAALRTYQDFRERLLRELNTEPAADTTRLYKHLRRSARVAQDMPPESPSAVYRKVVMSSRKPPVPLNALVGRERDVEQLLELMGRSRLVTLVGAGGVGKTRLAIEVAKLMSQNFETVWVDLSQLPRDDTCIQAIANALGVPVDAQAEEATIAQVLARLEQAEVLVIADNCEHVLDSVASTVETLLQASESLRVLATSRQRLGVVGEAPWRVPSLQSPDRASEGLDTLLSYPAANLFVQRARAARPDLKIESLEDLAAIADICKRLDGIPLALELAAARIATLSPTQVAERLDNRFALLTTGARGAVPRQKTLAALIEWSYELLDEPEQRLLRRLSVFAGSCSLEAADMVLGTAPALDALEGLVEKSLLLVEQSDQDLRYRMPESVREYALTQLASRGEAPVAREQHLSFYLALARRLRDPLRAEGAATSQRLLAEGGNLHDALAWAAEGSEKSGAYEELVAILWPHWRYHGGLYDGCLHVESALDRGTESGDLRAELELAAWQLTEVLHGAKHQMAERSLRALGDADGDTKMADSLQRALQLQRQLGHNADSVFTLRCLAEAADQRGDVEGTLQFLQETLQVSEQLGSRFYLAFSLHELGCVLYKVGKHDRASAALIQAVELLRLPGGRHGVAFATANLSLAQRGAGQTGAARASAREALATYARDSDWQGIQWGLKLLAEVGMEVSDAQWAAELLGRSTRAELEKPLYDVWVASITHEARRVIGDEAYERFFRAAAI